MDIARARAEFEAGRLSEAVVEPAERDNGWIVLVRDATGALVRITDHAGAARVYHDLDRATRLARDIGFREVRVEERY